jgi:hypothetical protein
MGETQQNPSRPANAPSDAPIFGPPKPDGGGLSPAVWGVAALIVIVTMGIFAFAGHKKAQPVPTTLQPPAPYAASLPLSNLAMSESESLSGGKVTYLDGRVRNTGGSTIASATVQVVFENDEAMPPSIQTVPLTLVRTTQPYIDIEPVSADPLKPGDSRDFRLTFEAVPGNWNQAMPKVRIIQTGLQ